MTSVLSLSWPRRTRRRYWSEKKSSRADKRFGNSSAEAHRTEKKARFLCVFQLSAISFQPSCGLSATAFTAYCLLKQRGWETF